MKRFWFVAAIILTAVIIIAGCCKKLPSPTAPAATDTPIQPAATSTTAQTASTSTPTNIITQQTPRPSATVTTAVTQSQQSPVSSPTCTVSYVVPATPTITNTAAIVPVFTLLKTSNYTTNIVSSDGLTFTLQICNTGGAATQDITIVDDWSSAAADSWSFNGPYYLGSPAPGIASISSSGGANNVTFVVVPTTSGFTGCYALQMNLTNFTAGPLVVCNWHNNASLSYAGTPAVVSTVNMSDQCSSPTPIVTPTLTASQIPTATCTLSYVVPATLTVTLTYFCDCLTATVTPTFTATSTQFQSSPTITITATPTTYIYVLTCIPTVSTPFALAVDSSKTLYSLQGQFLPAEYSAGWNFYVEKYDSSGNPIGQWGTYGTGTGQFWDPSGIALDSSGQYVFVSDTFNNRIQKFNSSGSFLLSWGGSGSAQGQFNWPWGIAVSNAGIVYVADSNNSRIQEFDLNGNTLAMWGSSGSGNGNFAGPAGIAIDNNNSVLYITETGNYRVQKFDLSGNYLLKWGSSGNGPGQFKVPYGVAVDSLGYVYVLDSFNNRVQKFDSSGNFIQQYGNSEPNSGSAIMDFCYPYGIAIDSSNTVYVADGCNSRIQEFKP